MGRVMKVLLIYYLLINLTLFLVMGIDKRRATRDKRRVAENTLFLISLLGGSIGGLMGMKVFLHKTRKAYFYIIYVLSALLHLALIYFILTKIA